MLSAEPGGFGRLLGMQLVLVPTPIGNLEDLTLRAVRVLREAEVVACEDTRRTRGLLAHLGIEKKLFRLDQHTMHRTISLLEPYGYVAYVTDAGTPGISDPGVELVADALRLGWQVEALPGPTALVPAVVLSGFKIQRFVFEGFLPVRGRERHERILALAGEGRAVVLYEAPHRLKRLLSELSMVLGERRVCVCRELSKKYEEIFRGSLVSALAHFDQPRGEFVVVLEPAPLIETDGSLDEQALLKRFRKSGLSGKDLMYALTSAGVARNRAYMLIHNLDLEEI